MKKNSGFTLIEMLVALVLFVVLAFFATQSLANLLQTRNKAEVAKLVRQEADYVTGVVERHLRGALSAVCDSPTQISYTDPDGRPGSFSCINVGAANAYIASGSARITSRDVIITSCSFTCLSASQVSLNFGVRQAKATTDPKESSSISVSSQVILRNQ